MAKLAKLYSLGDQVLVSGGNFLTIAICAHALPLSEQGKFTYVFASYMGLLLLNVAGIFQGAAVRAPSQDGFYRVHLSRLQFLQAVTLSTLVGAAWMYAGEGLGWHPSQPELLLLVLFLLIQQFADFDRRSAYVFSGVKRALVSSALVYPGRLMALVLASPDTVIEVLEVLIFSAAIPAIFSIYTACKITASENGAVRQAAREHLLYSRPFIASAFFGWLWAYLPIFMLGTLHGKEQAALLASIRGISNIANVLMEQLETKVVADWARLRHLNQTSSMERSAVQLRKLGGILWVSGMLLFAGLGQEIVTLVLGEQYSTHWYLLVIGWLGYGVYFLARVAGVRHRVMGMNKVEMFGNFYGAIAALIAGYLLISSYSTTGAAWAYMIISAAMYMGQQGFVRRALR